MIEFLKTFSAQIIAICALALTIIQAYIQRRHNVLSVRPHLSDFVNSDRNDSSARLKAIISNNGIGPAFIESFQAYLDGKECDPEQAVQSMLQNASVPKQFSSLGKGYAMKPGEEKTVISVIFPCKTDEDVKEMEKRLNRLDLKIEYKCSYGKKFTFDTRTNS
ncbi:hypothetical protein [Microbulbifer elongatus]|uniref:hypothetical protein n=1 Tax=Microbulbifer elongatus TaxID=86173 RepID=UPI001CFC7A10|nr:hypothetical protein [Microbulbifer elongatus]